VSARQPQAGDLAAYLCALYGTEPPGSYAELRTRRGRGMAQSFYPVRDTAAIAAAIADVGRRVYLGVAPRTRREGTRAAIERVHALWADCDGEAAVDALRHFAPLPAIVLGSGSAGNVHAYWPLLDAAGPAEAELANRQLARALGADVRSTDAARILRPPGSFNHKGEGKPRPVEVRRLEAEVFTIAEVVGKLPPAAAPAHHAAGTSQAERREFAEGDVLATIAPPLYVRLLAGADVPDRGGMVRCPLPDHEDRTPSCYVYPDAAAGWYCYGCGRGGSLIDLGAELWGIDPRGRGYHDLRRRLARELCGMEVPS
jgi:RepB DNA-primase N-terminal domain